MQRRDNTGSTTDSADLARANTQGLKLQWVPAGQLQDNPANWRRHPAGQLDALRAVLNDPEIGWAGVLLYNERTGRLLDGHARKAVVAPDQMVPVLVGSWSEDAERRIMATLDPIAALATPDIDALRGLLASVTLSPALEAVSSALQDLLAQAVGENDEPVVLGTANALSSRFVVPPFSVLDARSGQWQERKRAWKGLGLGDHVGRKENLTYRVGNNFVGDQMRLLGTTSIFDPVLAEVAYRWFCPPQGTVLDPFSGGPSRGIVAAALGRRYTGIDLRPEQCEANRDRWAKVRLTSAFVADTPPDNLTEQTPVCEVRQGVWIKRDDLFSVAGVRGGKARACWAIAQGANGLVTASGRFSPQANIVAHVAWRLGIPCRCHVHFGDDSPETVAAEACGATIIRHRHASDDVLAAKAHEDAERRGYRKIDMGMASEDAVLATAAAASNLPPDARRIVIPVRNGIALAGVLHGMARLNRPLPILGVCFGREPSEALDRYAPANWRELVTFVPSLLPLSEPARECEMGGVFLDPFCEAKCLPHLTTGDVLWAVGIRSTAVPAAVHDPTWIVGDAANVRLGGGLLRDQDSFDFILSCPPYADLERYSDDPKDLSNMDWPEFVEAYRACIREAVNRLKPDRFACWVIGDVRDKSGMYRNLPGVTVQAFECAGAALYNDAIYVSAAGSLMLRAGRPFVRARKLGRTHQHMMVFLKGDPHRATMAVGPAEFGCAEAEDQEHELE